LSQEKREKKMVSNIVEISPDINKGQGTYKIDWVSRMARILAKKTRLYELKQEGAQYDILVLHAYGYGCCGEDWNLHLSYLTKRIKANLYSVDFPGFGDSEGKKFTSRA
jgi:pimeloyl-ACP methyl ester carboxylesterase